MPENESIKFVSIGSHNFKEQAQVQKYLSTQQIKDIEIVSKVLPFKTNNYVINKLIDWENFANDPIFILNFPQREMLIPEHYNSIEQAIEKQVSKQELSAIINNIRFQLNPHPAGQMTYNVPEIDGVKLMGIQHKYKETMLFFPSEGQTCHAFCTFCFRWPQFTGIDELKFQMRDKELMVKYLQAHPEITDILFTGGDPLIMKTHRLKEYIDALLQADLPHLQNIRIGTKTLTYWPYRYTHNSDAAQLLEVFRSVEKAGKHLAIMAHFNHYNELKTPEVREAIRLIRETGAQIRTQSPIMRNINDNAEVWSTLWKEQVRLGMIPYYMFVARETGAQAYFAVPLVKIWTIFKDAYKQVSGIARTVRGPSMSATPGKVQILGVTEMNGEKLIALNFIQGRDPEWVEKPFFAKYDEKAIWLTDLKPAFSEKFFFEDDFEEFVKKQNSSVAKS